MMSSIKLTVGDALREGIAELNKAGVETPVLDAEVLLAHVLQSLNRTTGRLPVIIKDRAWLYAHSEQHVNRTTEQHFIALVRKRVKREPVAYIVGHKEFYGLDFLVNRNVLVPRPESELLVEQANAIIQSSNHPIIIVDIGTGSGAIAVAVAEQCGVASESSRRRSPVVEQRFNIGRSLSAATPVAFFATDISPAALSVARKNARRHGVEKKITFLKGNLLEPILKTCGVRPKGRQLPSSRLDSSDAKASHYIIVANLPYLPTSEWRATQPEVRKYEPRGALDGGKDGLKYYRELFEQLDCLVHNSPQPSLNLREGDRSIPPLRVRRGQGELRVVVLCEICPEQARGFEKMARGFFPKSRFQVVKDLGGRNRVVKVQI